MRRNIPENWTAAEAARYLCCSPRSIRRLIEGGVLPGGKVLGKWIVPADAVKNFMKGKICLNSFSPSDVSAEDSVYSSESQK